jgi:peptidoglycan/LPS O-acetylase OafA/YrhL
MEKKDALAKGPAMIGTVLVWIPVLAPVILGFVSLAMDGIYRFDYLMPAELGIMVFIGGALLLWGAFRARSRQGIVTWAFSIAALAVIVLITFGDVVPGSWEWMIVIGLLIAYSLAIVAMGIGGIFLWKDLVSK